MIYDVCGFSTKSQCHIWLHFFIEWFVVWLIYVNIMPMNGKMFIDVYRMVFYGFLLFSQRDCLIAGERKASKKDR